MDSEKSVSSLWNDDTEYALGLYKIYAKILGIWPLERHRISSMVLFSLFIIIEIVIIGTYVISSIRIGYCGRTLDFVEILTILIVSSVSICKVIVSRKNLDRMYFVISSIIKDWAKIRDIRSHRIMMEYAYKGRVVCLIELFISLFLIFRTILLKLPGTVEVTNLSENMTITSRIIPYGPTCWISTTMSVHYYHTYYLLVCLHWLLIGVAYVGNDIYIFGIGMHLCGQFELLYGELQEIIENGDHHIQYRKLIKFIERHNHLLTVAHTVEEVYNVVVLIEMISNTLVISISGIVILWAVKLHSRAMAIPKLIRITIFYIEIFMISYVGEKLSAQTEKLQLAVYNIPWYDMSLRMMKDIVFIMMRINHPFHLSAGKIANMNYEGFKNIVKSTFSYFSILRLMLEE